MLTSGSSSCRNCQHNASLALSFFHLFSWNLYGKWVCIFTAANCLLLNWAQKAFYRWWTDTEVWWQLYRASFSRNLVHHYYWYTRVCCSCLTATELTSLNYKLMTSLRGPLLKPCRPLLSEEPMVKVHWKNSNKHYRDHIFLNIVTTSHSTDTNPWYVATRRASNNHRETATSKLKSTDNHILVNFNAEL